MKPFTELTPSQQLTVAFQAIANGQMSPEVQQAVMRFYDTPQESAKLLVDGLGGPATKAGITAILDQSMQEGGDENAIPRTNSRGSTEPAPTVPPVGVGNWHDVKASSFADPADVAAFRRCKASGGTDQECFRVGDNGIGAWGDDCTTDVPMCALPVEDWLEGWGSKAQAHLRPVEVECNGKVIRCLLGDTMPHRANIHNGAGIDLSPAACKALGLTPPIMVAARWRWA